MRYICSECGKEFETFQQLGGHVRMAHPKKRGRKTKERMFLDFLMAILKAPVRTKEDEKPAIFWKDLEKIMKMPQKKLEEIQKWGIKNGYKELLEVVYRYKITVG